jgi:hypothetical protein
MLSTKRVVDYRRHYLQLYIFIFIAWILALRSFEFKESGIVDQKFPSKGWIMVASVGLLVPELKGGDYRVLTVIKAFRAVGYNVTFVYRYSEADSNAALQNIRNIGVEVVGPLTNDFKDILELLDERKYTAFIQWLWPYPPYLDYLEKLVVKVIDGRVPLVSVADDVMHQRIEIDMNDPQMTKRIRQSEFHLWSLSSVVAGINSGIVNYVHTSQPSKCSVLLRYCQEIPEFADVTYELKMRRNVAFVGYENPANVFALNWLLEHIIPNLNSRHGASIHVYGKIARPTNCLEGSGCVYHGPVSEVELVNSLRKHRLLLAPVFTKAGISTKIVKSLSCGTVVATTFEGLSGMEDFYRDFTKKLGVPFVVTTVSNYSSTVATIYSNSKVLNEMSLKTVEFVREHFSMGALVNDSELLLKQVDRITCMEPHGPII